MSVNERTTTIEVDGDELNVLIAAVGRYKHAIGTPPSASLFDRLLLADIAAAEKYCQDHDIERGAF
jgi:hypothetical protein